MKIVIDGRLWTETGPGRYIRNLVWNLQKIDGYNEYFVLLLKKDFERVELSGNFHKVLADFRWYTVAEQLRLPKIIKEVNPDLVHFPHFNVPLLYRGKYIVTIHDLIHHHFQMKRATTHNLLIYKIKTIGYKRAFRTAVKKSAAIAVPSEFVKTQLVGEYKVKREKITVTYEGVEESLVNLLHQVKDKEFKKVSRKLNFAKPYFFYVGNAHPHKNLPRLINAFNRFRQSHPNFWLVLAGPEHSFWQQIKKEHIAENVIFAGYVSDRELVALYRNAEAFITASREEGFGIPLLEAMACGCPVISSNSASLPEVGGNTVLYFDPLKEDEMVSSMEKLTSDNKLRKMLIKEGLQRSKLFSWKKMARETLEVYQKAIDS